MPVDYDAPRTQDDGSETEPIEEITSAQARATANRATPGLGDTETDEFELPGADLSDLHLVIEVKPQQSNEFTCTGCYLVRHRTQLRDPARLLCVDCA